MTRRLRHYSRRYEELGPSFVNDAIFRGFEYHPNSRSTKQPVPVEIDAVEHQFITLPGL